MAGAIFHLLGYREGDMEPTAPAPYGTVQLHRLRRRRQSWAKIARGGVRGAPTATADRVVPVSTADYYANAAGPIAPRPDHSALDLSKLESVGFHMPDWEEELGEYLKTLV